MSNMQVGKSARLVSRSVNSCARLSKAWLSMEVMSATHVALRDLHIMVSTLIVRRGASTKQQLALNNHMHFPSTGVSRPRLVNASTLERATSTSLSLRVHCKRSATSSHTPRKHAESNEIQQRPSHRPTVVAPSNVTSRTVSAT